MGLRWTGCRWLCLTRHTALIVLLLHNDGATGTLLLLLLLSRTTTANDRCGDNHIAHATGTASHRTTNMLSLLLLLLRDYHHTLWPLHGRDHTNHIHAAGHLLPGHVLLVWIKGTRIAATTTSGIDKRTPRTHVVHHRIPWARRYTDTPPHSDHLRRHRTHHGAGMLLLLVHCQAHAIHNGPVLHLSRMSLLLHHYLPARTLLLLPWLAATHAALVHDDALSAGLQV